MVNPKVQLEIASIVGKAMIEATVQYLVKSVPNVAERITKAVCKSGSKHDQSRSKKGFKKGKKFHEINESESNDNGMDDLADQVQSSILP